MTTFPCNASGLGLMGGFDLGEDEAGELKLCVAVVLESKDCLGDCELAEKAPDERLCGLEPGAIVPFGILDE